MSNLEVIFVLIAVALVIIFIIIVHYVIKKTNKIKQGLTEKELQEHEKQRNIMLSELHDAKIKKEET